MRADDAPDPADARDRRPAAMTRANRPRTTAPARRPDELIAEYDDERPARRLGPRLDRVVVALCFLTSLFVLWQVFAPLRRGNQYYLVLFLAAVLPLVFVCYRPRARRSGAASATTPASSTGLLAGLALLVALYPVLPIGGAVGRVGGGFDAFLDRQGRSAPPTSSWAPC